MIADIGSGGKARRIRVIQLIETDPMSEGACEAFESTGLAQTCLLGRVGGPLRQHERPTAMRSSAAGCYSRPATSGEPGYVLVGSV